MIGRYLVAAEHCLRGASDDELKFLVIHTDKPELVRISTILSARLPRAAQAGQGIDEEIGRDQPDSDHAVTTRVHELLG